MAEADTGRPELDRSGTHSLLDAAQQGILRIRQRLWAQPMDHFLISIHEQKPNPWIKLYSPVNMMTAGKDPQQFLWFTGVLKIDETAPLFVPYTGPLPNSPEYLEKMAHFARLRSP